MTILAAWMTDIADVWGLPDALDATLESSPPALRASLEMLAVGNVALALDELRRQLDRAEQAQDGELGLITIGLVWLAETRRFNLFPGENGADSPEIEGRWNARERLAALLETAKRVRSWPDARAAQLPWRWLQFLANLSPAHATLCASRGSAHVDLVLQIQLRQCEEMKADLQQGGAVAALAFVERETARVYARVGRFSDAQAPLRQASELYRRAGDAAGVASCLLIEADLAAGLADPALVRDLAYLMRTIRRASSHGTLRLAKRPRRRATSRGPSRSSSRRSHSTSASGAHGALPRCGSEWRSSRPCGMIRSPSSVW